MLKVFENSLVTISKKYKASKIHIMKRLRRIELKLYDTPWVISLSFAEFDSLAYQKVAEKQPFFICSLKLINWRLLIFFNYRLGFFE
jgi:hypothetical protein